MAAIRNENMHGPLGSPFEPCKNDVTPQSGDGVKGGVDYPPFGQWKQAANDLPGQTFANIPYSGTGQLETPMDATNNGSGIGVSGSSGTGAKGSDSVSTPYAAPWPLKG